MATLLKCAPDRCSTFPPDTTPGSWATSLMSHCIFSEPRSMPAENRGLNGCRLVRRKRSTPTKPRVELAPGELVAMRPEAVRRTWIPVDADSAPLPRRFAPDPDCCFRAKDAPAPETARARQSHPDRPETRLLHGSTSARCGSALAAV